MGEYFSAFLGGCLIGLASVLFLLFNGKILGVSGILGGVLKNQANDTLWRYLFVAGMVSGGVILNQFVPSAFAFTLPRSLGAIAFAGLLVGYGTRLGNGCTSGHGVCGVSRFSPRSIMATLTFIALGGAVVFVINHFLGGRL